MLHRFDYEKIPYNEIKGSIRVIDNNGFRLNVGIILTNGTGQLFWGRRVGQEAWQFPQGGLQDQEDVQQALFRELQEEVGLTQEDVVLLAESKEWLSYRLPKRLVRSDYSPYLHWSKTKMVFIAPSKWRENIKLDRSIKPEFDNWCWVSYWFPLTSSGRF